MRRLAVTAATLLCLAAPAVPRAVDVDWFGGVTLSDGGRTFLNLSVAHYGADERQLTPVLHRLPHPEDDLPVLLFLAHESRRSPEFILDLRLRGMSWWSVMLHVGVPPSRVFVAIPDDPGPPYGKAWGYYRKHPKERRGTYTMTDRQFCDVVGASVVGRAYGVAPATVLDARRRGTHVVEYVDLKEGERRGRGDVVVAHRDARVGSRRPNEGSGQSQSRGQGRSKGKGRDKH